MNLTSQLRHFLTYLAGLGTALVGWHLIAPDQAAAVNQAGSALVEPLMIIIGAVGVFLARAAMTWVATLISRRNDAEENGGGVSGGTLALLLLVGTMAGIMGCLPSCRTLAGSVSYVDPNSGAKGGLVFTPGQSPSGTLTVPIVDPKTGAVVGTVDLKSGK